MLSEGTRAHAAAATRRCEAAGLEWEPPPLEAWVYAVRGERVVYLQWTSSTHDERGCATATSLQARAIGRRVRDGFSWRGEESQSDTAWPWPFQGSYRRCRPSSRIERCTLERRFGAPIHCITRGDGFLVERHCLAREAGPATGIAILDYLWGDGVGLDYVFAVDDLRVRTRIDRAALTAAANWCTHRVPVSSPSAPDRPGERFE